MNVSDLRFRLATPADAAALGEFMTRNFLAAYGHCSSAENVRRAVGEHYGEAAQRRQIEDGRRCNLIVTAAERWAGHAQLHIGAEAPAAARPLPAVELARFYVDTAFHGRGVAQAMMAQVKAAARERGGASLWLSVWQDQPQAIRFYEKEGFRIVGELIFMVGDDPKDDWLMTCSLDW
jgi:ribosomal protein S18 acetylase RimI-like enzyme